MKLKQPSPNFVFRFIWLAMVLTSQAQITTFGNVTGGDTNPTWNVEGNLQVGIVSGGTLIIDSGGTVLSVSAGIGYNAGSVGTATMVTGADWTNAGNLAVGYGGNGTLNVYGGVMSNVNAFIGLNAGSIGQATVDAGGRWVSSGIMYVAASGSGSLNIDGGEASSTSGSIGLSSGSTGVATVGNGGIWTNSGDLIVGESGNGTLNVDGGFVTALETYVAETATAKGRINLNGGGLVTGQVLKGAGNGVFTFNGGQLQLTGDQSSLFQGFDSGSVILGAGGGRIETQGFNVVTAQILSGPGNFTKSGLGTLELRGANSYTGATTVVYGSLNVTGSLASTTILVRGFGTFQAMLQVNGNSLANTAAVTLDHAATLLLTGSETIGSLTGVPTSRVVQGSSTLITGGNNDSTTFTGEISGTGSLVKQGAGTFTLGGANSYSRSTVVNNGTLEVAAGGSISHAATPVNVASFAENNGTLTVSGGSVTASVVQVANNASATGRVNLNSGVVTTGQVSKGAGTGSLNFNGGTLKLSGNQTDLFGGFRNGNITLGAGGGTIDTQAFNVRTSLNITGAGDLTKKGTGTLTFSGTQSYTGSTTIEQGTLVMDGSLGGAVIVQMDGTFVARGSAGPITMSGGIVASAEFSGMLTTTSLTWNAGNIRFDLGADAASSDFIDVNGTLSGAAGSKLFTFTNLGWVVGNIYDLIGYDQSSIAIDDYGYTNGGGFEGTFSQNNGRLSFQLTAIPEPSAAFLALIGTVAFIFPRRRWNKEFSTADERR